jgi:KipI family sensor histidine kinase inhibitor
VPAFTSVAVHYRPSPAGANTGLHYLTREIEEALGTISGATAGVESGKVVDIPVCYGGKHGPDLEHVAEHCRLQPEEVIRLHSGTPAYVFMLGFAPGAPYIGVHDKRLAIGRRATPRTLLPAGSVAIANLQTMIYPNASPGGWHVIGATPAILFDPGKEEPALLAPGDTVNFVRVSEEAFEALRGEPQ